MKKYLAVILALTMLLSTAACGSTPPAEEPQAAPPATEAPKEPAPVATPEPPAEPAPTESQTVEVDKNLFSVELTIPAEYVGEDATQESLDSVAAENGYKSVTLNPDGSATYVMTKDQHNDMMAELKTTIDESLEEMVTSGDYPSFVSVEAKDDYSAFEVVLSTDTVGLTEGITALAFYMFGGMYNAFNGTAVDNISVSFISQATGEVIQTANSQDAFE